MARHGIPQRHLPGVAREDSDDELGDEDLPWEWIYDEGASAAADDAMLARKRRRTGCRKPVGARMGKFECRIGDCVLLKADGSNEAWVALICEFLDNDDGDMAANFMWFSTEKEIRNKQKKRTDFQWVGCRIIPTLTALYMLSPRLMLAAQNELYVSPSWDINPLESINGKAVVVSPNAFTAKYPSGRVPRSSPDYGKVFVCRRGCDTRTATYTDEFIWEDVYHSAEVDIYGLIDLIEEQTRVRRKRRPAKETSPEQVFGFDGDEPAGTKTPSRRLPGRLTSTPRGRKGCAVTTPSSRRYSCITTAFRTTQWTLMYQQDYGQEDLGLHTTCHP
jgi:origin recognition complex subunit 1